MVGTRWRSRTKANSECETPAIGEISHLTGRILDARGEPLKNAVVEIWQCDQNGAYLHTRTGNADKRDRNFQGFGRFLTGRTGEYYFRTIKPVPILFGTGFAQK